MGLPVGIEVGMVTFGSAVSYTGRTTSARLSVEPSARLVYNGIPLLNFVEEEVAANGQPGQMYLPVCDQAGFKATQNGVVVDFTNWSYTGTLTWTDPITKTSKSVTKVFQILSGQTVIDFDELPDSVNALPVTAPTVGVSSFLGKTGAVTEEDLAELDLGGGISKEEADDRYAPVSRAAKNPDEIAVGAITRSANGAATGFGVKWDDGATGVFVGTESTTTPGAIDSYTVTHVLGGVTTTYTQPALTRDANGAVTARPAMTVS